jgi:putative intracellular protease/amidase
VRDGNLITGQNPQSSSLVAQHVLAALGGAA